MRVSLVLLGKRKKSKDFQMMAGMKAQQRDELRWGHSSLTHMKSVRLEHGDLCDGSDAAYCMNGGTCYKITAMDTLTCV